MHATIRALLVVTALVAAPAARAGPADLPCPVLYLLLEEPEVLDAETARALRDYHNGFWAGVGGETPSWLDIVRVVIDECELIVQAPTTVGEVLDAARDRLAVSPE